MAFGEVLSFNQKILLVKNVKKADIKMIRSCYEIIVKTFERHNSNADRPTYTQWVARETVDEMANIDIIFRFLRKHDRQIAKMPGPGKIPWIPFHIPTLLFKK